MKTLNKYLTLRQDLQGQMKYLNGLKRYNKEVRLIKINYSNLIYQIDRKV